MDWQVKSWTKKTFVQSMWHFGGPELLAELNFSLRCALVFTSEANIEIAAKILFRLEAKKRLDFACFTSKGNKKTSEAKMNVK
jgi:hypothetical protein